MCRFFRFGMTALRPIPKNPIRKHQDYNLLTAKRKGVKRSELKVMGSEFERLEKAESELLESIRAKESERDALKKQFEELRAEINLILNDTRNELGDKIQAISGFDRPFRQTSRGVELPSWSVNDYDDDEYDTSRIMNDLKAISGQIKQKFDSLN